MKPLVAVAVLVALALCVPVQAHLWYNLAASRMAGGRRQHAVDGRDRAAGQMNPAQISEARRLAREWDAAHPREP